MRRCAGFLISIVLPLAGQGPASDFARGVEFQRSGDLQGARSAYEAALRSNPRSVETLSNLGMVHLTLGRHEDALRCFSEALAIRPQLSGVRYYLGVVHYKTGEFAKARAELETVLRTQPRDVKALHLLGLACLAEGRMFGRRRHGARRRRVAEGHTS
jgi:tetratricopeptide (TPR) repeat protein